MLLAGAQGPQGGEAGKPAAARAAATVARSVLVGSRVTTARFSLRLMALRVRPGWALRAALILPAQAAQAMVGIWKVTLRGAAAGTGAGLDSA